MHQKVEVTSNVGVKRKRKLKKEDDVTPVKKTFRPRIIQSITIVEKPLPEIGDFKYADTPSKVLGAKMT